MRIKISLFTLFILMGFNLLAQDSKYIEVTGSAEMFVEADEFVFVIGISEYWIEEFEKKKEFKDYKNKVAIGEIESQLLKDLKAIGIKKDQIKSTEVGNYWRHQGKEFLVSKKLEISLTDFSVINKIVSTVDRKGIKNMYIGELKNKELPNFRKDVKKQALLAAKEKAEYLVETLGNELGSIISIEEINNDNAYYRPAAARSNVMMSAGESAEADTEKNIKLRYEIRTRFEIK
ncbi:SIMPL domain-containing protein [Flammeovirga sp. MY04]|uniref:SIMPL domain-containing protein n=1 Tax=Flammeovirga sp. MY04 TaxID=1191459 RepID=UPI000806331D|nr:SIMPL domain-containing protein [Flammeovirga sp. MY04]ANQ52581.1 SIMPL domain-containing protein [Flammeovirga sp. MY04]